MARTLLDKVWEAHTVRTLPSGQTQLLIGLHLIHEVTTPQAFQMLKELNLKVRMPERTFGTLDHIIPTADQTRPYADPEAEEMAQHMYKNMKDFGVPLFDMSTGKQGIVHVIGPELGLSQPGMTIACGDSHTSTHGAVGAIAFGIGTSQVRDVLATQCLSMAKPKLRQVRVEGKLAQGRLRQGRDPRHHQHPRREGRGGLRLRVRGRHHRRHDHGRAPHRLQHVHRGRRALRLRQSRRQDGGVSPRPALCAHGRSVRPGGHVVEVGGHGAGRLFRRREAHRRRRPRAGGDLGHQSGDVGGREQDHPLARRSARGGAAHVQGSACPHGLRGRPAHQGRQDRRGLRGLVHQRAPVRSAHRRRGGQEGQGGQGRARAHRARLAAGGQGRGGRGPPRDLQGRGLRVAQGRLLHVPRHERRQAARAAR